MTVENVTMLKKNCHAELASASCELSVSQINPIWNDICFCYSDAFLQLSKTEPLKFIQTTK